MDFIKNKILIRSMLASLVPLYLYSLGYLVIWGTLTGIDKFNLHSLKDYLSLRIVEAGLPYTDLNDFALPAYFDKYAWLFMLTMACVYPFSQVSLWMLFAPFESYMKRSVEDRPGKLKGLPFGMKGNFAPVQQENQYKLGNISQGRVPIDINGVYLKNGPNEQFPSELKAHHWLQGDSMVHAVRIRNGELFYCNRYIETHRYLEEKKAGRQTRFDKLGEVIGINLF